MSDIRVRFAPSPTGYLHIGGARTALFNYLFARHTGGKYILRIEDTDKKRSTKESVNNLISSLKWLGLDWDEGPGIDGPFAPYFQTERFGIYNEYIEKLLMNGSAYKCFCTENELKAERDRQLKAQLPVKYSGKCKNLTKEEIGKYEDEGRSFVIRFKVPENRKIKFCDIVHKETEFNSNILSDFVIKRADGYPTYNFTVVIDDAKMRITHVLRGDDHLSNTPKQILLYEALDFPIPQFGHLSMILGKDGSRLSKRHGATSVEEFQKQGYLSEALINFLALLGWSPPEKNGKTREFMTKEELIRYFDINSVSKTSAIMNIEKLKWMNGCYIRNLDTQKMMEYFPNLKSDPFFQGDEKRAINYIKASRSYYDTLNDAVVYLDNFKKWSLNTDILKDFKNPEYIELISNLVDMLKKTSVINPDMVGNIFKEVSQKTGLKGKNLYHPIRFILSGKIEGPELQHFFTVVPKEEIILRLKKGLEFLRKK
jgi:glutamyl-tRNA synthetase